MAIRMRRGNEADFDPSKMLPGEWAVSTDTKYVRMCFSPGIVLRMATYEAFESDMAEIRKILSECQSIQTAVELIQKNVTNSELVIENYVKEAKQYRDEAEQFRNEASMFAPEGYEDLVKNVSENTVKIDTIIEKAELNIKNNAKGSNIHLTDSADSNVVALELYGKTEQNAYTGKNSFHFPNAYYNGTGLTLTKNTDGTYLLNGSVTGNELRFLGSYSNTDKVITLKNGNYKCVATINDKVINSDVTLTNGTTVKGYSGNNFAITDEWAISSLKVTVPSDVSSYSDAILKIMICDYNASDNFEPYVGGTPSPNPSYPQEIKSVKGKNLLDCRGLVEKTNNGVNFTPVYDENGNLEYINVNGTATAQASYYIGKAFVKANEKYLGKGGNSVNTANYFMYLNGDKYIYKNDKEIVYTEDKNISAQIVVLSGVTVNNDKFYPMIRPASITDGTYVPYGLLRIKTHGKNLLELTLDSKTSQGVLFSVDKENGTVTATGKATGYGQYAFEIDAATLKGKTIILSGTPSATSGSMALIIDGTASRLYAGDNGKTISVPSTCNQIIFQIAFEADEEAKNDVFKPMIRLASITDDTYEPYQENSITLSEPIELNGFNGVYDVVTSDGVTRRFAEVVFDGSDDEGWNITSVSNGSRFYIKLNDAKASANVLCTQATISNCGISVSLNFYIDIFSQYSSIAELKTHLAENPMTVVYELATPTTEELQSDFTALKTFYPETHVSNDADCDMSITYTADAKNYIDNKIALLTTAIYNNI